MIKSSRKFNEYFYRLYEANNSSISMEKTFEEIFESNQSRLEYLNELFKAYNNRKLDQIGELTFRETIDFIVSFINGREKAGNVKIPERYYIDQSIGAVIPSFSDMEFLLKILESNKIIFEMIYRDNPLYLKLPDESFNKNMIRVLEIKEHNIAHLLGLTEHEEGNDPSKNLLKKHFYSVVKDPSIYGATDAQRLFNWIISSEGKAEIERIHRITLDFVKEDKKTNPNSYIGDDLKPDSSTISKFKERYKKQTGLDYPIINFSRLMVKSLNTLNFVKLNNVVEVVLDFNAPKGKNNEKDIFLVNRNSRKIMFENEWFLEMRTDLLIDFFKYAQDPRNETLKKELLKKGINVNSQAIIDQLNIIRAHDFIGAYGINPDDSIIDEKIIEAINNQFERNVHVIGFDTEFNGDREIPLDKFALHKTHCDTSIALTVPELVGVYYKYGRTFFLDKIEDRAGVIMVSNVNDEIHYLRRVLDIKKDAYERLEYLVELKRILNENHYNYTENSDRQRR